jgi:hypothetical protein
MRSKFIAVGENIHCTRIYKVGGKFVTQADDGAWRIHFKVGGKPAALKVPEPFLKSADWQAGKVKHAAAAMWQARYGTGTDRQTGVDYIKAMAAEQERAGASYLDINVDEFSTDVAERCELMRWAVRTVQEAAAIPASIDSSNLEILRAGLSACDRQRGKPMINSVSLERLDAIPLAKEFNAVVIASAAGRSDLPCTKEGRLANLAELMPLLQPAGLADADIHVDPLVFPISTDSANGKAFLDTVSAVRQLYGPAIHVVAGLSNVSFGMPSRNLINLTFTYLAREAGADGGIVDPLQIGAAKLDALDTAGEGFQLAKALLLGQDEFGMNFITASREGKV